jgi:polysaccharide pyruvyl transferase WcaK-like protein
MGTPITSKNRGVLALAFSLVKLCAEAAPNAELCFLLRSQSVAPVSVHIGTSFVRVPTVNTRLSLKSHIKDHFVWAFSLSIAYYLFSNTTVRSLIKRQSSWVEAIANADIVGDIRGGDSFSDIYGLKRFLDGFFSAWTVLLIRGSILQFPQTYGPFKSSLARFLAKVLFKNSSLIAARDKQSYNLVRSLAPSGAKVILTPDVAFSLQAERPCALRFEIESSFNCLDAPIGLNINGLMYNGGYSRSNMFGLTLDYPYLLRAVIEYLLANSQRNIWLIPHTVGPADDVESDNHAARRIWESIPKDTRDRVCLVGADYSPQETKWIIGQCDFFIGSRMHACIAALSQRIPCIGLAYSMKFFGVFESVGMQDWVIDTTKCSHSQAIAAIKSCYGKRDHIRCELKSNVSIAIAELNQVFKEVLGGNNAAFRHPQPNLSSTEAQ